MERRMSPPGLLTVRAVACSSLDCSERAILGSAPRTAWHPLPPPLCWSLCVLLGQPCCPCLSAALSLTCLVSPHLSLKADVPVSIVLSHAQ